MPYIELQFTDGSTERRELSRTQPLSIGQQSFNDIVIDEPDIGSMHCRIIWNKSAFEVTSASGQGIDVNGVSVSRAMLKRGDIIRIGSVDLVYIDTSATRSEPSNPNDAPHGLKTSGPEQVLSKLDTNIPSQLPLPPIPVTRHEKAKPAVTPKSVERDANEMPLFEGPVFTESQELAIAQLEKEDSLRKNDHKSEHDEHIRSGRSQGTSLIGGKKNEVADRPGLRPLMQSSRPGEQDIFRSPLVIGLTVGGTILLLVTGIFWFMIGREAALRLYDRGVQELTGGQFAQAITTFDEFIKQHPNHSMRKQAERGRDKASVQKEISGASPSWKRGLDQVLTMVENYRNDSDFSDLNSTLVKFGEDIAIGAAKTAEQARDPELLIVSDDARAIIERYSDPAAPPTGTLVRIQEAREAAEKAIGKQNTFDSAMELIDAALTDKKPILALSLREKLVRRFPDYANHKRVKEALANALNLERMVITIDETERKAEGGNKDRQHSKAALGVFHTRARTDESSVGRVAYVIAKDCCYAIDTMTGELLWRRVLGLNSVFFPIAINGARPWVLMFDEREKSLICCTPTTGELIWQQRLDSRPLSAPLIHEGQIFLPTDDHSLCRIEIETGRLTATIRFSQNISGQPAISRDERNLLLVGEMSMIYALTLRPLAAAAMTFTDHAAGSVMAPPVSMGTMLLVCEHDRADSTKLRLWDASKPDTALVELKGDRVPGVVRDPAVLRGNQLVVPSSNEHLAAFLVTDEAGRAGLSPVAQYRIKDGFGGPMFVSLGSDLQFWAASSAFRRFEIGTDSIRMDPNAQAFGIASQPLQLIGEQFFVGRKAAYHDAVTFSAIDRERMQSPWRTVVGAELLEIVSDRSGEGIVAVNEAGQIVSMGATRLAQGGIELKAATEFELPQDIRQPLIASALHDGRIALAISGDSAQLNLINNVGSLDGTWKVGAKAQFQSNVILTDHGLVASLPGRIKLFPTGTNKKVIQDWIAPAGEEGDTRTRFLTRIDGNQFVAINGTGVLRRIQIRTNEVAHLAMEASVKLDHPIDVPPTVRDEMLFIAESSGSVKQLNVRAFDIDGQRSFPSPVRGIWMIGEQLFVLDGEDILHAVLPGKDLKVQWSERIKGIVPAGAPVLWKGRIWISDRNGTIRSFANETGQTSQPIQLPQVIGTGLRVVGSGLFAIAIDGSIYRVDTGTQP